MAQQMQLPVVLTQSLISSPLAGNTAPATPAPGQGQKRNQLARLSASQACALSAKSAKTLVILHLGLCDNVYRTTLAHSFQELFPLKFAAKRIISINCLLDVMWRKDGALCLTFMGSPNNKELAAIGLIIIDFLLPHGNINASVSIISCEQWMATTFMRISLVQIRTDQNTPIPLDHIEIKILTENLWIKDFKIFNPITKQTCSLMSANRLYPFANIPRATTIGDSLGPDSTPLSMATIQCSFLDNSSGAVASAILRKSEQCKFLIDGVPHSVNFPKVPHWVPFCAQCPQ